VLPRSRALAIVGAALLAASLAGCTSTVSLEPATDAGEAACAEVTVRLPEVVDGQERRWTDAQSTGAWGSPAAVILACGVTPPGPTEAQCLTIEGVDWIVDESDAPQYRLTTYGRTPAVEVLVDNEVVSPNVVLTTLASAVGALPRDGECTVSTPLDLENAPPVE
jgi:hypothetical protein